MFATRRTIRVRGRIIVLTNSIRNSNTVKGSGVPSGMRWEDRPLIFLIREKIAKPAHKLRARNITIET
jgi:hypothetical protein